MACLKTYTGINSRFFNIKFSDKGGVTFNNLLSHGVFNNKMIPEFRSQFGFGIKKLLIGRIKNPGVFVVD